MPRRVSDTFKAGMISDVINAEGSVVELRDMYVRRSGELAARGRISVGNDTITNKVTGYTYCGTSAAQFHPNLGVVASQGAVASSSSIKYIDNATSWQLAGSPLDVLTYAITTEGVNKDQVPMKASTVVASATGLPFERIIQMTNAGDEVIMAGDFGSLYKWGGSLLAAYKVGTVAIATSSATTSRIVTGTGTSWSTAVQAGQYILIQGVGVKANGNQPGFRITKVISNTQLEIECRVWLAAGTGLGYRIQSQAVIQSPDGVWNGTDERPRQGGVVAYHSSRIFTAVTSDRDTAYNTVYNFDRVHWAAAQLEGVVGNFQSHDLWHTNGYLDVFPGVGGSIRGLASMGTELTVIKSHGLFRITGSVNYDGSGTGLGVQIISTEVGANGFNSWVQTSRGLVIASYDGLYLYDPDGGVKSLTDGRIKRWWEACFSNHQYVVTQFEDKVIVSIVEGGIAGNDFAKLVWDAEQDIFWTMTTGATEYTAGVSRFNSSDAYIGDTAFTADELGAHDITNINHKQGFGGLGQLPFDFNYSGPNPGFISQPLPLGVDALSEGRITNVLMHVAQQGITYGGAAFYDTVGKMRVEVRGGKTLTFFRPDFSNSEFYGSTQDVTDQLINIGGGTEDRVYKMPIDGSRYESPAAYIVMYNDNTSGGGTVSIYDYAGNGLRVYAFGFDYQPTNTPHSGSRP